MSSDNSESGPTVWGAPDDILSTITMDDTLQFLDSIDATKHCWLCGRSALGPVQKQAQSDKPGRLEAIPDRPAFVMVATQSDLEHGFEVRSPAFVMGCQNCGFTFRMLAAPLAAWKREHLDG